MVLQRYKVAKKRTDARIASAENWWKLRNAQEERRESALLGEGQGFKSCSGWLHNVIASKHADAMEAYPAPVIRPREPGDRAEAERLNAILPCVLENNRFEEIYDEVQSQKLKFGTGIYKIVWDRRALNGLGDVSISKVNPLNLYTEPGVEDVQKSRYVFQTEAVDKEVLEEAYPELRGRLRDTLSPPVTLSEESAAERVGKVTVVECYYRRNGKLHYIRFVGEHVLYASENDPFRARRGFYDHGMYPFVFDALFKVEGSPFGYGYVDLCRHAQTAIDLLNTSFVRNAVVGAVPRYFCRTDGAVNEEEFLDIDRTIVHCSGNLGEDSLRPVDHHTLDGVYVSFLDRMIDELRETSGNTETATGNISSGVTAASAIAALQEASGKGSRDANRGSYRAFCRIEEMLIELFRQFYDAPRCFRILGRGQSSEFIQYTNTGLLPRHQGVLFGEDMGYRLPVFDISCAAQRKNAFSTAAQNELALQFYHLGFFAPENAAQALAALQMMDFDGKAEVMEKIAGNALAAQSAFLPPRPLPERTERSSLSRAGVPEEDIGAEVRRLSQREQAAAGADGSVTRKEIVA